MTHTHNWAAAFARVRAADLDGYTTFVYSRPDGGIVTCARFNLSVGLLAVEGHHIPEEAVDWETRSRVMPATGKGIDTLLRASYQAVQAPATISEWIGLAGAYQWPEAPPTRTKVVPCDDCDGTGEQACPHCDQDMDCETCDGSGEVEIRVHADQDQDAPPRLIRLGGHLFDLRLLAPVLALLPDGPVASGVGRPFPTANLRLTGAGWSFLMAARHYSKDAEVVSWPITQEVRG